MLENDLVQMKQLLFKLQLLAGDKDFEQLSSTITKLHPSLEDTQEENMLQLKTENAFTEQDNDFRRSISLTKGPFGSYLGENAVAFLRVLDRIC